MTITPELLGRLTRLAIVNKTCSNCHGLGVVKVKLGYDPVVQLEPLKCGMCDISGKVSWLEGVRLVDGHSGCTPRQCFPSLVQSDPSKVKELDCQGRGWVVSKDLATWMEVRTHLNLRHLKLPDGVDYGKGNQRWRATYPCPNSEHNHPPEINNDRRTCLKGEASTALEALVVALEIAAEQEEEPSVNIPVTISEEDKEFLEREPMDRNAKE